MNTYDVGTAILLTGSFTDTSGNATDPSAVALKVRLQNQPPQAFSPTKASTGVYTYNFTPSAPGLYYYRFEGSGAVTAAQDATFLVNPSPLYQ